MSATSPVGSMPTITASYSSPFDMPHFIAVPQALVT
jgi:hypothetical protein